MARTGLRKIDVAKARNQLIAEGKLPSVDAIRVALGNTGSKSTIHKYLKELERETETAGARRQSGAGDALQGLVDQLAATLHAEADARIEALQARHADEIRSLRMENEALRHGAAGGQAPAGVPVTGDLAVTTLLERQFSGLRQHMAEELHHLRQAVDGGRDNGRLAAELSQARKALDERDSLLAEIRGRLQQSTQEAESLKRQMQAMQIELAATQAKLNAQQEIVAELLFHSGTASNRSGVQTFKETAAGMFGGSRSSDWSWTLFDTSTLS